MGYILFGKACELKIKAIKQWLYENNNRITYGLDNGIKNEYEEKCEIKWFNPAQIELKENEKYIILSSKYSQEIRNQLLSLNVKKEYILAFDEILATNSSFNPYNFEIRKKYKIKAIENSIKYKNAKYRLTIIVTCFNAEKTLNKAIDSILCQKTNFKYKIYLVDDCSSDSTMSVINEYAKKFPEIIFPIKRAKNYGSAENLYHSYLEFVDTEYFCALDQDDYYINENKLQLQIDALDDNFECSYSAHHFIIKTTNQNKITSEKLGEGIINWHYYQQTSSRLYRATVLEYIVNKNSAIAVDYLLGVISFYLGKLYFIDKIMSVWDYHENGAWSGLNKEEKKAGKKHVKSLAYYYTNKEFLPDEIDFDIIENEKLKYPLTKDVT